MDGKFEGFIVTTIADVGPVPVLTMTSLDEVTITKLSIVGMTIVSMGSGLGGESSYYRLQGPMPIPDESDYEAFSMTFSVAAPSSADVRVKRAGRLSNIWIIFSTKHRYELIAILGKIERVLANEIKKLNQESELKDEEKMKNIFDNLQQITTSEIFTAAPSIEEDLPPLEPDKPIYLYTVNQQGELVTIASDTKTNLEDYPVLVIVNTVLQRIFVLKNKSEISNRFLFFANRAALNLNTKRWKSKFTVNEVYEPLESRILIDQASILVKQE
ncbi:MAG: hypothetical protein ACXAEU_11645 [Candidatus Hodarchaeales archaeon]